MQKRKIEDEIKYWNLLKNPIRLYGWFYPIVLVLLLFLGIKYVKNLDKISLNEVAYTNIDSADVKRNVELKKGGIAPAFNISLIMNPSPELKIRGQELFTANCVSCHGAGGKGDGDAGANLNPKPRNFATLDGWTNSRDFSGMFKTLREGIAQNGMAAYEYLPVFDRVAIILHIQTLAEFPAVTEQNVTNLDMQYSLSKGIEIPNQIPVDVAVSKIVSENKIVTDKAELFYSGNNFSQDENLLLNEFVSDKKKAFVNIQRSAINTTNITTFLESLKFNPSDFGLSNRILIVGSKQQEELLTLFRKIKNI